MMGSSRGTEADALDGPARPPAPRSGRRALAGAAIAATAMFAAAAVTARRRPLEATLAAAPLAAAPLAPHAATLASAQIATPAPTAAAANAFVPWPTATMRPSPPRPGDDDGAAAPAANATDDAPFEYHATACKEDCNCTTSKVPVLNGLDVVSPFHGNLIEGSRDFSYDYKGYRWYFKNAINRRAFVDDPGRYEPRFGGFCAYGLASEFDANGFYWTAANLGPPVDTRAYRIYNDYLYFFMSDAVVESFEDNGLNRSIMVAEARWRGWFPDFERELFNTRCNCKYSATESFECEWRR